MLLYSVISSRSRSVRDGAEAEDGGLDLEPNPARPAASKHGSHTVAPCYSPTRFLSAGREV